MTLGQWDWINFGTSDAGMTVTVSIPDLSSYAPQSLLRLVGWNGTQWVNLSGNTSASGNTEDSTLSGNMISGITAISIGRLLDSDADGIADSVDLDDDNDGILDTVENQNLLVNAGFETNNAVLDGDNLGATITPWVITACNTNVVRVDGVGGYDYVNGSGIDLGPVSDAEPTTGDGDFQYYFDITSLAKVYQTFTLSAPEIIYYGGYFSARDSGPETAVIEIRSGTGTGGALQASESTVVNSNIHWIGVEGSVALAAGTYTFVVDLPDELNVDATYVIRDTDGDGLVDRLDPDSDNDGCLDVTEAGFTDSNNDGILGTDPVAVEQDGLVTSGSDGYTTPRDANSNGTYDFQEVGVAPIITTQPVDRTICLGCSTSLITEASNADTYQWQLLNAGNWENIIDDAIYTGRTTITLGLGNLTQAQNGTQYRLIASNTAYSCTQAISNTVTVNVRVISVITNRQRTYRVKN